MESVGGGATSDKVLLLAPRFVTAAAGANRDQFLVACGKDSQSNESKRLFKYFEVVAPRLSTPATDGLLSDSATPWARPATTATC